MSPVQVATVECEADKNPLLEVSLSLQSGLFIEGTSILHTTGVLPGMAKHPVLEI